MRTDSGAVDVSRRQVLGLMLGLGVAACARQPVPQSAPASPVPTTGRVRDLALSAQPVQMDLGGHTVTTWAYGSVPGKPLRADVGDRVRIRLRNDLPEATSVHWHGLPVPNAMDGVPDVTMAAVAPGHAFTYEFVVPVAGTHWLHPHMGVGQLDRGLYAPFIVDDPHESGDYDREWIVVLDDWTDGVGPSPQQIYDDLVASGGQNTSGGMKGMDHGGMMMDGGDVNYPLYLMNGRTASDPDVLNAKRGERIRIRFINAGADTVFTVALGGHRMQVTHSDGYPVRPVTTQALRIGMGERYDVIVTAQDGRFPLVAEPEGKSGYAIAYLRTGSGGSPQRPSELDAYPLTVSALQAAPGAALPAREPDHTADLTLAGSMGPYRWTINGATYEQADPITVKQGELLRLRMVNMSMMSHPMHLHGHTFQVGGAGSAGPRKDTVLIPPMGSVTADLLADNPGKWMLHCHNAYHAEAGMMTRLDYQ